MTNSTIYQDIATRTAGDIYIGVVGPVRTGKSTFIKSFMEQLVLVSPCDLLDDPAMLDATSRLSASVTPRLGRQEAPAEPSLKEMVNAYELMLIRQSIRKHGSLRKAAKALGVAPSVLSRKLSAEK